MLCCVGAAGEGSAHLPHVTVVRELWYQLVGAYQSLKDPPTAYHSFHSESGRGGARVSEYSDGKQVGEGQWRV